MSTTQNKAKILQLVTDYSLTCPLEFTQFKKQMKLQKEASLNEWAEVDSMDYVERKLFEIPETLYAILKVRLDEDGWLWFKSKEGSRWFAKKFVEFRSSNQS